MRMPCKSEMINLYAYHIVKHEENRCHHIIVADCIDGIIRGICKIENEFEESIEDCRKFVTSEAFLVVSTQHAKRGYMLFDIGAHDLGQGPSGCNMMDDDIYENMCLGYPRCVRDLDSLLSEIVSDRDDCMYNYNDALADCIYEFSLVAPPRMQINEENNAIQRHEVAVVGGVFQRMVDTDNGRIE